MCTYVQYIVRKYSLIFLHSSHSGSKWGGATCSSCGLSLPSCCRRAGRRAGFCWMICLICWNGGWFLRNSKGFPVETEPPPLEGGWLTDPGSAGERTSWLYRTTNPTNCSWTAMWQDGPCPCGREWVLFKFDQYEHSYQNS